MYNNADINRPFINITDVKELQSKIIKVITSQANMSNGLLNIIGSKEVISYIVFVDDVVLNKVDSKHNRALPKQRKILVINL
jgi:hypothetical protein